MEKLEKAGNFFVEPKLANQWVRLLIEMKDSDIREGAIFGSEFRGIVGWQGLVLERFSLAEVANAEKYINSRIPGLVDLYNGKMRRKADLNIA